MSDIIIPVCFIALFLVLMWWLSATRSHWLLKVTVSILGVFAGYTLYHSIESYKGFEKPVMKSEIAGKKAMVYWAHTNDPLREGNAGDIVVWMRVEQELKPNKFFLERDDKSPQVWRFPYDRTMQDMVQKIDKKIMLNDGEPVEVIFNFVEGEQRNQPHNGGSEHTLGEWQMYELPPPKDPPKVISHSMTAP